MRMPNSKQMSEEQSDIYLEAPLDGAILVTGPPGTGKTVIAFLRAQTVANLDGEAVVSMFNKVLSRYTSNVAGDDFDVKTLHSWIFGWWEKLQVPGETELEGTHDVSSKVYLNCPYSEKEDAKKLGAKWDKVKKKWYVFFDTYNTNKGAFEKWMYLSLPTIEGDEWRHDWDKIFSVIYKGIKEGNIKKKDLNWGHLIIDEAQDFSPEMFGVFEMLVKMIFREDILEERPSITVFADENQRLNEETNSTIVEIIDKLMLPEDRIYSLTKNYRNTLQIARLSSTFYTGLRTGKPDLPDREGELPLMVYGDDINASVNYIHTFANNHDNLEIGVIAQSDAVRKKFFNKLKHRLSENKRLKVQTYAWRDRAHNDASKLEFDKGGVITVVNKQSCKGLEFDAVFLPELQSVSFDPNDKDQFMMEMYVMTSRARDSLTLMYSNEGDEKSSILKYMPEQSSGLLEYVNV